MYLGICRNLQGHPQYMGLTVLLGLAGCLTASGDLLTGPGLHVTELEICAPDLVTNQPALESVSSL